MTHTSNLFGASVIDETNWAQYANPITADGCSSTGYKARDFDHRPLAGLAGTSEFPRDEILDDKTIREMVEEQDRNESSLWHVLKRGPKLYRNQNPSNYCWFYATMHAMIADRVMRNIPTPLLSPLSGGCPCDGFANRGGWGQDAIEWLEKYGVCEESLWPSTNVTRSGGINRKYYTVEVKQNALKYRVDEWWDFRSRDFRAKATCVLKHRKPVSSGYNWMGHQMCTVRIVILRDGGLGCVDLDSYGEGGDFNERVLTEYRGSAEDMCSPRS